MSEKKSNRPGKMAGLFVQLKKIFGLNIATVAFGVLLLYMIFTAVLLVTSTHIESYQVTTGPLSRNETYTGISLREESVYKAESSGYVNYYAREGSKINAGGAVYGLSSGKAADSVTALTPEELSKIRSSMLSFSKSFSSSKFNNTYSFKNQLEGSILQYEGISTDGNTGSQFVTIGGQNISKAQTDGIILYSMDGYENKTVDNLTAGDFDQTAYHETDLKTDGKVQAGDNIYTNITSELWSLVIPLSNKQAAQLEGRSTIRVKFLKDDMTQSGDFSIIKIDGQKYGKIDFIQFSMLHTPVPLFRPPSLRSGGLFHLIFFFLFRCFSSRIKFFSFKNEFSRFLCLPLDFVPPGNYSSLQLMRTNEEQKRSCLRTDCENVKII